MILKIRPIHKDLVIGLFMQIAVCFILSFLSWLFIDGRSALSFLAGASIFFFANAYLVFQAFRHFEAPSDSIATDQNETGGDKIKAEQNTTLVLLMLIKGEFGKIVLCVLGFALVFKFYENPSYLTLFAGFALMLALHIWFAGQVAKKFD